MFVNSEVSDEFFLTILDCSVLSNASVRLLELLLLGEPPNPVIFL